MKVSPKLALFTILMTAAYIGLAILGWGGVTAYFANPARIVLTAILFALAIIALFTAGNVSSGEREDKSNRWVLAVFAGLGILAGYVPPLTDRYDFWTVDGDAV